ncbi:MAG TPA: 2-amino-4-hydroxy-6-hydroxymethyldihydropteridine diphosphokinase [Acidimicrobiia bacterium]|nr:2-amino-4-hydroxy-6-hydroxymethyldihydropteridine diphosphokinase [Acidimicrobiia bacterium]
MTRYAIGLGSNLGDRLEHLVTAVNEISSFVDDWTVSSLYETEPVGGPEQDPFLNATIVVDTDLGPLELLARLQEIEQTHGRERNVRWGPRTLDLDLLASSGEPHRDERLTVPHPRAAERAFVLVPLVEIWPDAPVGVDATARMALQDVDRTGVDRLTGDWIPPVSRTVPRALVAGQFVMFISAALALAADGRLPEGKVTALGVVGALLAMGGLILAFISARRLGPSVTPSPVPKKGAHMVMSGPYRYARHPIYGGIFLVLLGTALFLDSVYGVVASVAALVFFWAKSTYEERQLRTRFNGYRHYREVVHRRLIPFVI